MLRQKFFILIGILGIILLYFWGHNVGQSSIILRDGIFTSMQIISDILSVGILLMIAGGIGRRALHVISFDLISSSERLVIEVMIGLGIISLLSVSMGLIGQYNLLIWGVLLIITLAVLKHAMSWSKDFVMLIIKSNKPQSTWEQFVRIFAFLFFLSALLLALAPPFAWDSINYHLVVPQRYIAAGEIGQHLDSHFFGFPQNMEMLYGLLMMLGSDHTPAVLHLAIGMLGFIGVYHIVRRHSSSKAASVSIMLLMASFNLWQLFGWPYVDLAMFAYGTVAIIAIHQWTQDKSNQWLAITAIAASLAAGVKYTAAPFIIALYVLILWRDPKNVLRNTLVFGGFGVIFFLPWLVKGTLLYDNPVYPYLLGGPNWDDARTANFNTTDSSLLYNGLWMQIPILPFAATIFGIDNVSPYGFTTGPFLLTLPFLLILGWAKLPDNPKSLGRNLIFISIIVLLLWMLMAAFSGIGARTRLMLVSVPLAAILAGLAFHSIENWPKRPLDIVFILQATILVSLFFGIFDYLEHFSSSRVLERHTRVISDEVYLKANAGALYNAMLELEQLPQDSRVLFLWEPKTYYCPESIKCTGDILFDNWARRLQAGATPDAILEEWRQDYDYVLFFDFQDEDSKDGYSLWLQSHKNAVEQNSLFPQYFFDTVTEVWSDGVGYTLYEWE